MLYVTFLYVFCGGLGNQPALTYARCKGCYGIASVKPVTFFPRPNFKAALASLLQLSVRRKNTKEMFGGFLKSVVKSADEVLFSGVKVRLLLCLLP